MALVLIFLAAVVMIANPAQAATFGDMFSALGNSVTSLGGLLKFVFPVVGFACVSLGLLKFLGLKVGADRDGGTWHDTWRGAIMWILPGAALLALTDFAAISTESLGLSGAIGF